MAIEMALNVVMLYQLCVDVSTPSFTTAVLLTLPTPQTDMSHTWEMVNGRLPAMVVAEIAFLVALTSADMKVSTLAAKGLREIAMSEVAQRKGGEDLEESAKRYPVYEQLGDPSVLALGTFRNMRIMPELITHFYRSSCSSETCAKTAETSDKSNRSACSCLVRVFLAMVGPERYSQPEIFGRCYC